MHGQDDHITLTQAAKLTPGRPSTNCLWRWCRRGVLARNGERVRLEHVRIGGKIYTTRRWVETFGKSLADADSNYFDIVEDKRLADRPTHRPRPVSQQVREQQRAHEQATRELEAAGL